ncbi:hypothetical protein [Nocardioides zeicaulis]|uniref:DUF2029 domain-containing protein n=1 Tax=Nocardioides zeicaulis TaxID=1776857 RepID=A0ABV6E1B3_9ACTN
MDRPSPTRTDAVAAAVSEVVGGPDGDHSAGHPWWSPARVLVGATAVVLAGGMVAKTDCTSPGWGGDQHAYAHLCWSDVAGRPVQAATPPGITSWLERLAGVLPGSGTVATTAALAVLLAALAMLATVLLVRTDRHRPWAAAGWALSPVLLLGWISWEVVAAVGVALLLWGWTSGRAWLAGVGAGIGAAFALPVALALVGVLAVGGGGRERFRARVDAVVAAAAAYVVVTLPGRGGTQDADIGSVWLVVEQRVGRPSATVRTVVTVLVLALAAVAVWWLVDRAPRAGVRTAAGAGLVLLVAAVLVSGSAPPELALVVLPLAALAVRRWRDLLVWQGCELVSWAVTGWYVGGALEPTVTDDVRAYALAVLVRTVGLLWLVASVLLDASVDDDVVDVGRGEPDPDVDLLPDAGHAGA